MQTPYRCFLGSDPASSSPVEATNPGRADLSFASRRRRKVPMSSVNAPYAIRLDINRLSNVTGISSFRWIPPVVDRPPIPTISAYITPTSNSPNPLIGTNAPRQFGAIKFGRPSFPCRVSKQSPTFPISPRCLADGISGAPYYGVSGGSAAIGDVCRMRDGRPLICTFV